MQLFAQWFISSHLQITSLFIKKYVHSATFLSDLKKNATSFMKPENKFT